MVFWLLLSFVVDNVLQVDAQGLVQVVEELLVEDEGNTWRKIYLG